MITAGGKGSIANTSTPWWNRDVADVVRIRKGDALRRLINQLAVRTATELNIAEICRRIGVQRSTVEQYLDVLTRLSLVVRLGAWTSGEARREIKNAKHHFVDAGVAAALRSLAPRSFDLDADPTALGGLLESFVFSELLRSLPGERLSFLPLARSAGTRDRYSGRERQHANSLAAIEVKASTSVSRQDFRHMRWFAFEGPGKTRTVTSIVFYLGERKLTFGQRLYALPVSCLWGIR